MEEQKEKYYSVQLVARMEVCVLAESEADAKALALDRSDDFSWDRARSVTAEAEELYNKPEDEYMVQEFKDEGNYAEW
jgi:hypothetical protein